MTVYLDRCVACGAVGALRLYRRLTDTSAALRCIHCHSVKIQSPEKRQDDQTENYRGKASHEALWEQMGQDFFEWIAVQHPLAGRALEIGCSVGTFVEGGLRLGLQVEGVDIDRRAIAFGMSRGRPLREGTIADCTGPYDLIYCNHVFEHLSNPEEFLRHLRSLLTPGGGFAAVMPYIGLEAWLKGRRWIGWGPMEHYWLYSKSGLTALLSRSGLQVQRLEVRNGVEVYTFSDFQSSPSMVCRYFARKLVRGVADMVGLGWQIFVLAVRPSGEHPRASSYEHSIQPLFKEGRAGL